jgi:hypothetical protein
MGTITNSYITGKVYCDDGDCTTGGILGSDLEATFTGVTWTNHSDDDANDCTGDNGNPAGCTIS